MKPTGPSDIWELDLFRANLRQILNPAHPLLILAAKVEWTRFDATFAKCDSPNMGVPAPAVRLMVGLHGVELFATGLNLKHSFNESDESLLEKWVENPYWQAFCGFDTVLSCAACAATQHESPLHPTSLVEWRHTLAQAIASTEANTGVADAYIDKEYRGHDDEGEATIHIAGSSNRHLTRTRKKRMRRRSAVKPKIGHLEREDCLGRRFLAGLIGDAINVMLAAAGSNLRKRLTALAAALEWPLKECFTRHQLSTRHLQGAFVACPQVPQLVIRLCQGRLNIPICPFQSGCFATEALRLGGGLDAFMQSCRVK